MTIIAKHIILYSIVGIEIAVDISFVLRSKSYIKQESSPFSPFVLAVVALFAGIGIPVGYLVYLIEMSTSQSANYIGSDVLFIISVTLMLSGILFSNYSKACLRNSWRTGLSQCTQAKIVTNGPYAVIRHPMYLGLIITIFGFMLCLAHIDVFRIESSVLLLCYFIIIVLLKARFEEHWLRQNPEYLRYIDEVGFILPQGKTIRKITAYI